jgi:hypothetical protein
MKEKNLFVASRKHNDWRTECAYEKLRVLYKKLLNIP